MDIYESIYGHLIATDCDDTIVYEETYTYIGRAYTRIEARHLIKKYYGDLYDCYRDDIRYFLDCNFEEGIYNYIEPLKYLVSIQDDDEYIVTIMNNNDIPALCCCKDKDEAIAKAREYESIVMNIAHLLYQRTENIIDALIKLCDVDKICDIDKIKDTLDCITDELNQRYFIRLNEKNIESQ